MESKKYTAAFYQKETYVHVETKHFDDEESFNRWLNDCLLTFKGGHYILYSRTTSGNMMKLRSTLPGDRSMIPRTTIAGLDIFSEKWFDTYLKECPAPLREAVESIVSSFQLGNTYDPECVTRLIMAGFNNLKTFSSVNKLISPDMNLSAIEYDLERKKWYWVCRDQDRRSTWIECQSGIVARNTAPKQQQANLPTAPEKIVSVAVKSAAHEKMIVG